MKTRSKTSRITTTKIFSKIKSFQVFFLKDDRDQSVKVEETNKIDFDKVNQHLKIGGSIFILPKPDRFGKN